MFFQLALVATIVVSAADARPPLTDRKFHVIVNRANPVSSLTRSELSAMFMKRTRSWPDRGEIVPVDQTARSSVRGEFSRAIHLKSVAYVVRYWQRLIFSGRGIPPRELVSDAAVIELVSANRTAIGYVDRDTPLGDDVKAITVTK
ncbi:MAG TPA: hypothetical protein VIL97_05015 [Thermoanaerobaculia bacterium]